MKAILCILVTAGLCLAAEMKLGKPLALKKQTAIAEVNAKADALVGKTVQVKGKISEVCQNMGCWMELVDPATQARIRIKVNDG